MLTADGPPAVPGFAAVHPPGHVSYLLDRSGGVLFAGDAAGSGLRGGVWNSLGFFNTDLAQAAASVARLAELDFEVAVFGHGRAVTERAVDRFRALAVRASPSRRWSVAAPHPGRRRGGPGPGCVE